jgi:hypothetical protein
MHLPETALRDTIKLLDLGEVTASVVRPTARFTAR